MNFRPWLAASGWIVGISALTFLIGLILAPIVVIRLPSDFFVRQEHDHSWHFPHTYAGWGFWIARNVLGVFLIAAGIAMLILPGQGILTIAAGLMAMTFPGKRRLLKTLVHRSGVQRSLNWIRKQSHQPPFEFTESKRRKKSERH